MKKITHTGSLNKREMTYFEKKMLEKKMLEKELRRIQRGIARRQKRHLHHTSWGDMRETPTCQAAQRRLRQINRGSLTIANGLSAA